MLSQDLVRICIKGDRIFITFKTMVWPQMNSRVPWITFNEWAITKHGYYIMPKHKWLIASNDLDQGKTFYLTTPYPFHVLNLPIIVIF